MGVNDERARLESDPYALLPELYDLEHASFGDDIPLYLNLVEAIGDPILELGCGTGRVLLPLAEAGFRITGLDASAPMLDRARATIDAEAPEGTVLLHLGAMDRCDDAPGGPFGVVLAPLNALMHATTLAQQRQVLQAAYRALDPRGQLVIDVMNPTPDNLRVLEHGVVHEGSWRLDNGEIVDKFSARRVRPADQMIETELWYDRTAPDGSVRRIRTAYPMRYLHRAELELLLEACGYLEWEMYGSYELDPYDDGSERLIVTADPTPSRR
ncbi:MAG: class I SAM-dependent methyltransferase [Thermomicrobiales bacterium]